jgi:hypothetical protein
MVENENPGLPRLEIKHDVAPATVKAAKNTVTNLFIHNKGAAPLRLPASRGRRAFDSIRRIVSRDEICPRASALGILVIILFRIPFT